MARKRVRKQVKRAAKVGVRIGKYAKKEIDKELKGYIKKGRVSASQGLRVARALAVEAFRAAKKMDAIVIRELKKKPAKRKAAKRKKKR